MVGSSIRVPSNQVQFWGHPDPHAAIESCTASRKRYPYTFHTSAKQREHVSRWPTAVRGQGWTLSGEMLRYWFRTALSKYHQVSLFLDFYMRFGWLPEPWGFRRQRCAKSPDSNTINMKIRGLYGFWVR